MLGGMEGNALRVPDNTGGKWEETDGKADDFSLSFLMARSLSSPFLVFFLFSRLLRPPKHHFSNTYLLPPSPVIPKPSKSLLDGPRGEREERGLWGTTGRGSKNVAIERAALCFDRCRKADGTSPGGVRSASTYDQISMAKSSKLHNSKGQRRISKLSKREK